MTEGESEGRAFSDYFFYDPKPHEKLSLSLRLLRTGSAASWVDVYVRFGEMPTTELYDAKMRCDRNSLLSTFVLQADRLLNERLCVLVVGRGDSFTHQGSPITPYPAPLESGSGRRTRSSPPARSRRSAGCGSAPS